MTEEPYRWLEAIQNRREYIEDQLAPGLPVVVVSGAPGLLLLTTKSATPKLFEIYDHLALGTLGHPADIEKVRQAAIDAAHMEGFARSPSDVSSRRLVSYNLAPALKSAFEQIYAAPLLFRGILAELGATPAEDSVWKVDYDGAFLGTELSQGAVISGPRHIAKDWLAQEKPALNSNSDLPSLGLTALRILVWAKLRATKDQQLSFPEVPKDLAALKEKLGGDGLEFGLLDRSRYTQNIGYRVPTAAELGL